jgi:hypothetical protein
LGTLNALRRCDVGTKIGQTFFIIHDLTFVHDQLVGHVVPELFVRLYPDPVVDEVDEAVVEQVSLHRDEVGAPLLRRDVQERDRLFGVHIADRAFLLVERGRRATL